MEIVLLVLEIAAEFVAWLLFALLLAFLTESLTEYIFGTLFDKIPKLTPYKWTLMYVAAIVGVFLCIFFKLDLLYILTSITAIFAGQEPIIAITVPGMVITGVAVGRGSNFIHQLIANHLPPAKPAQG